MRSALQEPPRQIAGDAGGRSRGAGVHPALLLLFVGSGCSALIYEIVWFQLLQLVIGSSAVSLGVLLGTFMGGMCLGSLSLPRLVGAGRHPLRVYAALEFGTALMGLLLLWGMPLASRVYVAHVGHGMPGILLRGLVCAACLLPPTFLMGATLPAISRWVETTRRGVSWMGLFYAGNIGGAVFGCLLAGFYLLRVFDMAVATYVAAGLNLLVAMAALVLARFVGSTAAARGSDASFAPEAQPWERSFAAGAETSSSARSRAVYVVIALSGLSALGAEVVWTRLLSLMMGGTVYSFSIILAVFLIGLGIGSGAGSILAGRSPRPRLWLGWCQMLLVAAIAWTAYMVTQSLPYWPIDYSVAGSVWFTFQLDLLRCLYALLPATVLWGASFPLALASAVRRGQDPGRLVGGVYAANTIGAVLGGVVFSIVLIPAIGSQGAERCLMIGACLAGVMALLPLLWTMHPMQRPSQAKICGISGISAHFTPSEGTCKAFLSIAGISGVFGRSGSVLPATTGASTGPFCSPGKAPRSPFPGRTRTGGTTMPSPARQPLRGPDCSPSRSAGRRTSGEAPGRPARKRKNRQPILHGDGTIRTTGIVGGNSQ